VKPMTCSAGNWKAYERSLRKPGRCWRSARPSSYSINVWAVYRPVSAVAADGRGHFCVWRLRLGVLRMQARMDQGLGQRVTGPHPFAGLLDEERVDVEFLHDVAHLRQVARPLMKALAVQAHGSVSLGMRDRACMVYVETCRP
jgi:hypothetical protein